MSAAATPPPSSSTPQYNKLSNDLKRLPDSFAKHHILDLFEALRKDWYPNLTDDQMIMTTTTTAGNNNNNEVKLQNIKSKILDDWCKDRHNIGGGVWKLKVIDDYWSRWLKILRKDPPEPEYTSDEESKGAVARSEEEEIYMGPKEPTPEELFGDGVRAAHKLWHSLTGERHLAPIRSHDLILQHINPSKNFRMRALKGLDSGTRIAYYNSLVWLEAVIKDALRILEDTEREGILK